ncbi:MAG: Lpg1974 family pore-forming outer membrane protein [Desulfobacteraceae bacterium]|jgi:hypothetical protein
MKQLNPVGVVFMVLVLLAMLGGSTAAFAQDAGKNRNINALKALNEELKAVSARLEALKKQQAILMKEAGLAEQNEPQQLAVVKGSRKTKTSDDISIRLESSRIDLKPKIDALDYAMDDPNNMGEPNGALFRVEPEAESGYRYAVWVNMPKLPFEIGIRDAQLDGTWHSGAADTGPGALWHTRMHPDSAIDSEITRADATYKLDYHVTDIEVRKHFQLFDSVDGAFLGGIRFARIQSEFYVDYVDGGNEARYNEKNKTSGFGPIIGVESGWQLPYGFRLEGMLNLCFLHSDTEFEANDDVAKISTEYDDELIPVFGYRLGMGWQRTAFDTWLFRLGVGYEGEYWADIYHENRFPDDVDEGIMISTEKNMVFQGLTYTFGVEKRF